MDLKMFDDILNDNMINIILVIFLMVFQCILLPKLPPQMVSFADNIVFKVAILTLIAFMANRNLRLSILIAVLFLLVLNIANNNNIENYTNSQYTGGGHCTSGIHNYTKVHHKGGSNCNSEPHNNNKMHHTGGGHCTSGSHNYTKVHHKGGKENKNNDAMSTEEKELMDSMKHYF